MEDNECFESVNYNFSTNSQEEIDNEGALVLSGK